MTTEGRLQTPVIWQNVMAVIVLGKAFIAGAGLGIAALGIVDVATAASIKHFVAEITHNRALDVFAYGGGAIGFVTKLVLQVLR